MSRAWKIGALSLLSTGVLAILLDSCLQFRMSTREINHYFSDKEIKGTSTTYAVGSRVINYLEVGQSNGPLVLFVHGSPGSLSAFIDFMSDETLASKAHLIAVDRPGFGQSNFGNAEPSLRKQAALLKPILEKHRQHRPIILVGHSLGGPLIARMAIDYPELVDGIILVAPSIDPDLEPHEWYRAPLATPFLSWLLPRSIRASNAEIYKLKPELEEMLPLWNKLNSRTTLIQGCQDTLVDPGNADFALRMINHALIKVITVEDMDHFVPWNNPKLIRDAVLEQLSELR